MSIPGIIIASILFLLGMVGIILPILPGAPLLLAGMVIYGFFDHFTHLNWPFYLGQVILMIMVFGADYLANIWGVKKYGGSKFAVWGSLVGALLGVIAMGPLGIIVGPFAGAVGGEFIASQKINQSLQAGVGTLVGFLGGALIKLALQALMIVWFFSVIL